MFTKLHDGTWINCNAIETIRLRGEMSKPRGYALVTFVSGACEVVSRTEYVKILDHIKYGPSMNAGGLNPLDRGTFPKRQKKHD